MNIIFVSGATARARTLTLDWRHLAGGTFAVLVLFFAFTLIFNYVTLRYAASINHPLLQAIMLADQRQEAQKTEEAVPVGGACRYAITSGRKVHAMAETMLTPSVRRPWLIFLVG